MKIEIPYAPRYLQQTIHDALETHRFGVAVCHRRFGKTTLAINQLQKAALLCKRQRPRFGYIAPTYTQGKAIAWAEMKSIAQPISGHTINESELRIDYPNGGQVRIYGADNPDSLRGIYLDGVVLDEYGQQPPRIFSEVIRPLLADRLGWALFIGTPNGKNQFYDIIHGDGKGWIGAINDPTWFFAEYKASQTKLISAEELASSRTTQTEDEYAQEWECSFEASVRGAVWMRQILQVKEDGRIQDLPYDPTVRVNTDWDLGVGDATAIWFSQKMWSGAVHLIDYYEASGYGLDHYRKVIDSKPYAYDTHWAPHDIEQRDAATANRLIDIAHRLGLHFQVSPKVQSVEDRIHAARMMFPLCRFDRTKCKRGIEALQHYRWKETTAADPTGKPLPVHDWASHAADAFGALAYRDYLKKRHPEREAAAALKKAQYEPPDRAPASRSRGGYR